MKIKKKMLVTCAFPYANGELHLGHLLEHIQADIWVRFHRMKKYTVFFICSDDAHGTAILLKSKDMNIEPEKLIDIMKRKHMLAFSQFSIQHDHYSSTNSQENKKFCSRIFNKMNKKNYIEKKKIFQLYDTEKKLFLADRFIKGICPFCKKIDQHGDHCNHCGATYDAINLINPVSILSQSTPIVKKSLHFFFKLSLLEVFLKKSITSIIEQNVILNKTKEWFQIGLRDWDISRDSPYFGFKIPGLKKKYFYVWFDAPIGYISCFKEFCNINKKLNFNEFWVNNKKVDLFHFIGKDIIYFHTLFWPAILESFDYRQPTKIFVHGYVTIHGKKLSKSKKIIISATDWLSYFDSDSLRYYFAAYSTNNINDIEINLENFRYKINADIVNNLINLAARNASFLKKYFSNTLSGFIIEEKFYLNFTTAEKEIELLYRERKFSYVVKKVIFLSNLANKYINDKQPWILIKNPIHYSLVHGICSLGINIFRILMIFLTPIMPNLSKKTEKFLNTLLVLQNINIPLVDHKIENFKNLYNRINKKDILKFMSNYSM